MADLLALVPTGPKYKGLVDILQRLKKDFPEKYNALAESRIEEWIGKIDSGERDADQTRDDIVRHVIGKEAAMEKYKITEEEFEQLVLGENEGGMNFPTGEDVDPGLKTKEGAPKEESRDKEGVGREDDGDPDTVELMILKGKDMKWFFDKATGKWYVAYGLPNSNRVALFEADPGQMDALFGVGFRPVDYEVKSLKALTAMTGYVFSGNIAEMEGSGSFEAEVERVTALALDEGLLPDWAKESGAAMDIIYQAQAEGKSTEWVIQQLSKLPSFKARFPSIEKFMAENNLGLAEAIGGWLEYEAGVRQAMKASGLDIDVDPAMIGNLLVAGHSITTINDTVQGFRRMKQYAPAMEAFNKVLAAEGLPPIQTIQEMLDFIQGRASVEIYDLYEASSIQEAAVAAGLGHLFTAEEALAAANAGNHTLQSATMGMQKAAEMLLRLRHEVDVGKFNLNVEDLIDINLGQPPRSGANQADIQENINRAVLSAQKGLQSRSGAVKSFSRQGTPQATSLAGLRQQT